jgi:hypothetical protein
LAGQIRDLFPALVIMEEAGRSDGAPRGSDRSVLEQLGDYRILREDLVQPGLGGWPRNRAVVPLPTLQAKPFAFTADGTMFVAIVHPATVLIWDLLALRKRLADLVAVVFECTKPNSQSRQRGLDDVPAAYHLARNSHGTV